MITDWQYGLTYTKTVKYQCFFQLVYVQQSTNSWRQDFKLTTLVQVDYEANKHLILKGQITKETGILNLGGWLPSVKVKNARRLINGEGGEGLVSHRCSGQIAAIFSRQGAFKGENLKI